MNEYADPEGRRIRLWDVAGPKFQEIPATPRCDLGLADSCCRCPRPRGPQNLGRDTGRTGFRPDPAGRCPRPSVCRRCKLAGLNVPIRYGRQSPHRNNLLRRRRARGNVARGSSAPKTQNALVRSTHAQTFAALVSSISGWLRSAPHDRSSRCPPDPSPRVPR